MEDTDARDLALIRKLVWTIADVDDNASFPEAARQAMDRWEQTQDRLAQLEAVVETDLDVLDYKQMTRKDRVRMLQSHLVEEAKQSANNKAAMTYREVKYLFNGEPSPGYCYELMRISGEEVGFEYQEFAEDRTNRLTVDTTAVKGTASFHAVNKATTSEGD